MRIFPRVALQSLNPVALMLLIASIGARVEPAIRRSRIGSPSSVIVLSTSHRASPALPNDVWTMYCTQHSLPSCHSEGSLGSSTASDQAVHPHSPAAGAPPAAAAKKQRSHGCRAAVANCCLPLLFHYPCIPQQQHHTASARDSAVLRGLRGRHNHHPRPRAQRGRHQVKQHTHLPAREAVVEPFRLRGLPSSTDHSLAHVEQRESSDPRDRPDMRRPMEPEQRLLLQEPPSLEFHHLLRREDDLSLEFKYDNDHPAQQQQVLLKLQRQDYKLHLSPQQQLIGKNCIFSRRGFVKADARWSRRVQELRRQAMRRRTSREIFREGTREKMVFAAPSGTTKELEKAREAEELRRLQLVDPLVCPVERRRFTVQWWPNFAREAVPRLITALRQADVVIEVRDARLPWLTQLPLQLHGNEFLKPRVVVLTHADGASEIGNAQWARFFRFFYRLQAAEELQKLCNGAPEALRLGSSPVSATTSDTTASAGEPAALASQPPLPSSKGSACTPGGTPALEQSMFFREPPPQRLRQQQHLNKPHESLQKATQEHVVRAQHNCMSRSLEKLHEELLAPPVPPRTPVIFMDARQDGAGVVRLEKAVRKIWRKWHEFHKDAGRYRRAIRQWQLWRSMTRPHRKAVPVSEYRGASGFCESATTIPMEVHNIVKSPVGSAHVVGLVNSESHVMKTLKGAGGEETHQNPHRHSLAAVSATIVDPSTAQFSGSFPTAGRSGGWGPFSAPTALSTPLPLQSLGSGTTAVQQRQEEIQQHEYHAGSSVAIATASGSRPVSRQTEVTQSVAPEEHRCSCNSWENGPLKHLQGRPQERGGVRWRRPLRVLLVGMPNVGKSALCNRLLHAKKARSYNYPGVSKVVTHYRRRGGLLVSNLHRLFDCIDSPGLLPPRPTTLVGRGTVIKENSPCCGGTSEAEAAAVLLSHSGLVQLPGGDVPHTRKRTALSTRGRYTVCPTAVLGVARKRKRSSTFVHPLWADDENIRLLASLNMIPQSCLPTIEEAAVAFLQRALNVWARRPAYVSLSTMTSRYHVDPLDGNPLHENLSGCEYLHRLAEANHNCCTGAASQRVMTDLQKGYLGRLTLEIPPAREQLVMALGSLSLQQLMKKGDLRIRRAERGCDIGTKNAAIVMERNDTVTRSCRAGNDYQAPGCARDATTMFRVSHLKSNDFGKCDRVPSETEFLEDGGAPVATLSESRHKEFNALQILGGLTQENPKQPANTELRLSHCETEGKRKAPADGVQCGEATDAFAASCDAPTAVAAKNETLPSQILRQRSETLMEKDPKRWMQYTSRKAQAHAGYPPVRKRGAHVFVWRSPALTNGDTCVTERNESSNAPPHLDSSTVNADAVWYRPARSLRPVSWEAGAYEGW